QVFEVHLVDNTDAGWHHSKGVKGLLTPFEELVTLAVAGEFASQVHAQCLSGTETIHVDRVIDHQIDGHEGFDDPGVASEIFHRAAHGGEINQKRHSGEILQYNSRHHKGDFFLSGRFGIPGREGFDV